MRPHCSSKVGGQDRCDSCVQLYTAWFTIGRQSWHCLWHTTTEVYPCIAMQRAMWCRGLEITFPTFLASDPAWSHTWQWGISSLIGNPPSPKFTLKAQNFLHAIAYTKKKTLPLSFLPYKSGRSYLNCAQTSQRPSWKNVLATPLKYIAVNTHEDISACDIRLCHVDNHMYCTWEHVLTGPLQHDLHET